MQPPYTLPFDQFWNWLMTHPNCIVRVGTPEVQLYDDADLHWTFAAWEGTTLVVQVLRGKRIVGELFIDPEHVSYVQGVLGEIEDEHIFELVAESETDRLVTYYFVMAHGYDEQEPAFAPGRVH